MKKIAITTTFFVALLSSVSIFAEEITGTWIQIDDKTGSPKALIEIKKQTNGSYSGKIIIRSPIAPPTLSMLPKLLPELMKMLGLKSLQKLNFLGPNLISTSTECTIIST